MWTLQRQISPWSIFTWWMAGSTAMRKKVLAPKSSSTGCLPLVRSLPRTDWSALSHCSSSRLIPAAGFWERSAQDWTWCHQSPVMRLNNQEPWALNRKEGTSTGLKVCRRHGGESEESKEKWWTCEHKYQNTFRGGCGGLQYISYMKNDH